MVEITANDVKELTEQMQESFKEIEIAWKFISENDVTSLKKAWIGKDSDVFSKKLVELDEGFREVKKVQDSLLSTFQAEKRRICNNNNADSNEE